MTDGSRDACEDLLEETPYVFLVVGDVFNSVGVFSLPQLVSPDEAADYLGVSAYTIRERLKSGELPGRKHGSRCEVDPGNWTPT